MNNREHYDHHVSVVDHCTDLQSAKFDSDGTLFVNKSVEYNVLRREVWCDDCNVKLKVSRDKIEYGI